MYLFLFSGSQEGRYQPGMVGYMGLPNLFKEDGKGLESLENGGTEKRREGRMVGATGQL